MQEMIKSFSQFDDDYCLSEDEVIKWSEIVNSRQIKEELKDVDVYCYCERIINCFSSKQMRTNLRKYYKGLMKIVCFIFFMK